MEAHSDSDQQPEGLEEKKNCSKPERSSPGRRSADRPHYLTLFTSFGALVISLGGFAVSWRSYRTSSKTAVAGLRLNESNQKLTEMVQSASIETTSNLITPLESLDKEPVSKSRKLVFSWTIANVGNTAANRVRSSRVVHLVDDSTSREPDQPNHFTVHMGPRQKQSLPFSVTLAANEYRQFRREKLWVEINGQIKYDDIFGKEHQFNWLLRLKGDGTLEYRQFSPAESPPTLPGQQ